MLNIAICDDNTTILTIVENAIQIELENQHEEAEIHKFTNGNLLLDAHKTNHFDILFLDIEMPI